MSVVLHGCFDAEIQYEYEGRTRSYTLPFESGYIYRDDNKARILLKFIRGNKLFTKDTGELLHIYISGDIENNKRGEDLIVNAKVFFVRVQLSPFYGFMTNDDLRIQSDSLISGNCSSTEIYPIRDEKKSISISFQELPLSQVTSMTHLYEQDTDYNKEALKEYFGDEWGIE